MSKTPSLKRLASALARDNIGVTRAAGAYRFTRLDDDTITAEVLLPDGFPIEARVHSRCVVSSQLRLRLRHLLAPLFNFIFEVGFLVN